MDFQCKDPYQFKIRSALKVIRDFDWLLNSYVLDFFVENHWSKIPSSWRETFENIEPPDLAELILNGKSQVVLPLSFIALLKMLNILCIPRKCDDNHLYIDLSKKECEISKNEYTCRTHPRLVNLFLKHVKKKKRHEISLISSLVGKIAKDKQCHSVVDIGSGLGHLVRTLAYKYTLKSIGIEAQTELTEGARELDNEFEYNALKHLEEKKIIESCKPHHINLTLTPDTHGNILSERLKQYTGDSYGLVGLHPCGDLGPLLLKIFIENPEVKFICIVGCCYMKLSCEGDKFKGYPLSEFVSNIRNNELSYESREIACHAIETYCDRLKKGQYEDLQVHTFRALLEKILVSKWPEMRHMGLRSVKHYNTLTFERYCEIATERLDINLSAEEIMSDSIQNDLKMWKKVVIFYTLRLMLAPLVESVILMDRTLSLREKGAICEINALFDPTVSPRNHILIASKPD